MATILIYPEVAQVLRDLIESVQCGDYESGQLTLTDRRGSPIDLILKSNDTDPEVDHE